MDSKRLILKFILLFGLTFLTGLISSRIGFNTQQVISMSIFSVSVFATLLFWDFRVAIAFLGVGMLLLTKTVDLENIIKFASLEVILFLMGMMVLVGLLKESGFFAWLITLILRTKNLTAKKFVFIISILSALLSCVVDEVTSIVFMSAAVLEICDYFEVEPTVYIIISILATNIGSTGTVLGNPIGILIASKSGLTFEDFLFKAFPLMLICLLITIFLVIIWYRKSIIKLDKNMNELKANEILIRLISVPPEKKLRVSLSIFGITLLFISLHHRLELLWYLETNTLLLSIPLLSAGAIMIWKWNKARSYIEKDVDWWTLLFFMFLFAKAGTLKYTGATDIIAKKAVSIIGNNLNFLSGIILWVSFLGSSILDNVVLVAAFIPIIQGFQALNLNLQPLWWALLFGGCFGGNLTMVGSTANIVALGLLEKERGIRMNFFRWLGIGLVIGIITTSVAWVTLLFIPHYYR
ncbi:MAG: SLC13 family permease [Candidatus Omnitrophica bacterium]|nr:SLC13 family permease [Candidatus Omnitrophota bacterium]